MTTDRLGAHIPWAQIIPMIDLVLDLGMAPEIAFKGPELDSLDEALLDHIAQKLRTKGIRPTLHAPFFDLNPGALDPLIRQVTHQRLSHSLKVAGCLNAHLMVIHPGYDKWRYPNLEQVWLALAKDFFTPLIEQAGACNCRLALENIYEEIPDTLVQIVNELDSEWFGHCFDTGHWQLFGKKPMAGWLEAVGSRLFHLHLHDNRGLADDHLPVGDGSIDFDPLREYLKKIFKRPSMTLEAHSYDHLQRSLEQVREHL